MVPYKNFDIFTYFGKQLTRQPFHDHFDQFHFKKTLHFFKLEIWEGTGRTCVGGELEGDRPVVEEDVLIVVLPGHHDEGLEQRVLWRGEGALQTQTRGVAAEYDHATC